MTVPGCPAVPLPAVDDVIVQEALLPTTSAKTPVPEMRMLSLVMPRRSTTSPTAPVLKVRVLKVAFDAFNSSKLAPAAKAMLLLSLLLKSRTMSLFPNMLMSLLSLSLRNAVLPVPTKLTQLLSLSVNEWWPGPVCWTGLPVPAPLQGPPEVPAAWAVMGPAMARADAVRPATATGARIFRMWVLPDHELAGSPLVTPQDRRSCDDTIVVIKRARMRKEEAMRAPANA